MAIMFNPKKRPKICIVSATPLPIHFFLREHIKHLALTNEVFVLTNLSNDAYVSFIEMPITVIQIRMNRQINLFSDLLSLVKLFKFFLAHRFDLVWGVGPKAGLLSMTAAKLAMVKKRLFIFQGEVWSSRKGFLRSLLKFLDSLTAKMATHLLAVGKAEASFLIDQGVVNQNEIQVLGSGSISGVSIKKSDLNRKLLRRELGIPYEAVLILFVGRIHPDKGILDLAQAFKKLKSKYENLHLMVVGPDEGALLQLKRLLVGFNDSFHLVGFSSDVNKFYQVADIYCLPSYREGFPISILEASANYLPIIASNIYGNKDAVIEGVTGLFYEVAEVDDLVIKIEQLICDSKLRSSLGRAGANYVRKQFDRNIVVKSYVSFINNLVSPFERYSISINPK